MLGLNLSLGPSSLIHASMVTGLLGCTISRASFIQYSKMELKFVDVLPRAFSYFCSENKCKGKEGFNGVDLNSP